MIQWVMLGLALFGLSACSSSEETELELSAETIKVNTRASNGSRSVETGSLDSYFSLLFWQETEWKKLASGTEATPLYAGVEAIHPVDYYNSMLYDTQKAYLANTQSYLYATGFAPSSYMTPTSNSYSVLQVDDQLSDANRGRLDFMSCDARDTQKGSYVDRFGQDKNKLLFRHLTSKLVFVGWRDNSMEQQEYVRNVRVSNIQMSDENGSWRAVLTPTQFSWKKIPEVAVPSEYGTPPSDGFYGYVATKVKDFSPQIAPENPNDQLFLDVDNPIDSCYLISEPNEDGSMKEVTAGIKLKMDIYADLSFSKDFTNGPVTKDKVWKNQEVTIYAVDASGNLTSNPITAFQPGREYRIYIYFYRTHVYLVAKEEPWQQGGVHYVPIVGEDDNPLEQE